MRIVPTTSCPTEVPRFARLQVEAWGHLYPHLTVDRAERDLLVGHDPVESEADPATMCRAWFAVDADDTAMGVVMLLGSGELEPADEAELPGPFLAGLVVAPQWRERGVATGLVSFVIRHARDLGLSNLRLVTEHEVGFYERRGWRVERQVTLNSVLNTVMITTLAP